MPQLVVNMKVSTQNKISSDLKSNRFKMRHAPYSNRKTKRKLKVVALWRLSVNVSDRYYIQFRPFSIFLSLVVPTTDKMS